MGSLCYKTAPVILCHSFTNVLARLPEENCGSIGLPRGVTHRTVSCRLAATSKATDAYLNCIAGIRTKSDSDLGNAAYLADR